MRRHTVGGAQRSTQEAGGAARSPLYRGFTKATFSVRPDQLAALRGEARRRADRSGAFRPDVSEIVREAIDRWLGAGRERRTSAGRGGRRGTRADRHAR